MSMTDRSTAPQLVLEEFSRDDRRCRQELWRHCELQMIFAWRDGLMCCKRFCWS
jgi:hypothetical protein